MKTRIVLGVLIVMWLTGCTVMKQVAEQNRVADQLRVTGNPDVVKGCRYIANVNDNCISSIGGPCDVRDLKYNAAGYDGADTLFTVDGHHGDVYACKQ